MTATASMPAAHDTPAPSLSGRPLVPGLRAIARITARAESGTTGLPVLDGDGPFDLRRLRSDGGQARVCVLNAMSTPHNGDRLRIEVTVEPGADLHVTSATASIALPGPAPGYATYDVTLRVDDNARLHWLPEPTISAARSDLRQLIRVELAPTARILLGEQQILGRAGEPPGRLSSRLIVRRAGETLLDQHTAYGPGTPAWDGPAVLGGNRAIGQLLHIGPDLDRNPPTRILRDLPPGAHGVITPIADHATLLTALAPDTTGLTPSFTAALPARN